MRLTNVVSAVDVHACGEPGRVITGGVIDPPGASMFEKMQWLRANRDDIRLRMLREPRGYPASCCNVILPATDPAADAGYVIVEQTEYPPMSGSNTICVVTVLVETGMVPVEEPVTRLTLETPAGLIKVSAQVDGGKCRNVTFENVPAFAVHLDATVEVPTVGPVVCDVAWGGMFYVIADAAQFGIDITPDTAGAIARYGEMLRAAAAEQLPAAHPENPDIPGISISQLSAPSPTPGVARRNAVTVSTGTVDWDRPETWRGVLDRSPCGTGTCAKMAALHAKGELALGEDFVHEGPLGTVFTGRLVANTKVGDRDAVVPTLAGTGWITGFAHYGVDPDDPFPNGFTVGDLWGRGT